MQALDIVNFFRILVAEPYKTRWSDSDAMTLASQAQRDVARETRWLVGRYAIQTVPGQQEYAMRREIVALERVYVVTSTGPQQLRPTSIPKMTGEQLRLYDSSAANFTSQWYALPPAPYPIASAGAYGVGWSALPMFPGQPPQYYLRGANIGLVPALSVSLPIVTDVKDMPPEFVALTDVSPFPLDWKETIAWKMCALAYYADQADDMENKAMQRYGDGLSKLISWVSNLDEGDQQGPQILTHRTFFEAPGGYGARW
jgi:hypothetical protein